MRQHAARLILAFLTSAGCGGGANATVGSSPSNASTPKGDAPGSKRALLTASCPAVVDARELLDRHARANGTAEATIAALPRTMRMELDLEKKRGLAELVLDKVGHRSEESVGGVFQASGIDAKGAWSIGIAGVPFRLQPNEATSIAIEAWLLKRAYLAAFDAKRDVVTCTEEKEQPSARVRIGFRLPELGNPEIDFDLASAAILALSATQPDGKRVVTEYDPWSDADASGVRWPIAMTHKDSAGNVTRYRVTQSKRGRECRGVRPAAPTTRDCLAMPTPPLAIEWPASGVVKVPMKYYLGELSLRVRLGDRDAWALLDSGASITVVDATTPAGASFVSGLEVSGSGSSQKIRAGLGELSKLQIGELKLAHVPAASIPIPALDAFGNRRPEVIVGFSLFLAAAVRVDYAKNEISFARSADAFARPASAPSVAVRVLGGKPVADVTVDGVAGAFLLDTGNSGGLDMTKRWADANGFPGNRPKIELVAKTGAGHAETAGTLFRVAKTTLGPISHDDRVVQIDDPPEPGIIAGLVGNEIFAHCAAVVFDLAGRAVWFEPPCNRPSPEAKAGWRLAKNESPEFKDRPWVIEKIVPTGAAAQAGFEIGDRILSVDGVPAEPDVSKIQPVVERPEGTRVPVAFVRNGERKQVTLVLKRLLSVTRAEPSRAE